MWKQLIAAEIADDRQLYESIDMQTRDEPYCHARAEVSNRARGIRAIGEGPLVSVLVEHIDLQLGYPLRKRFVAQAEA